MQAGGRQTQPDDMIALAAYMGVAHALRVPSLFEA